jgi:hypothetical protein
VHEELTALPSDKARWMHVKGLVESSDVVIGVWQDVSEPNGVGLYIVKGDRRLRQIIADQQGQLAKVACIPCEGLEQAVALKEVAGEPPAYD